MKQMIRFSVAALCLSLMSVATVVAQTNTPREASPASPLVQILPGNFNAFVDDLQKLISSPIWDAEKKGTGVVFAVPVPHLCRVNFEVSTPKPFSHLAFPHWKGEKTASKMAGFDGELMAKFLEACSQSSSPVLCHYNSDRTSNLRRAAVTYVEA
jgi:hypothetical protein